MAFIKKIKKENSITLYKYTGEGLEVSSNEDIQDFIDNPRYAKVCFIDLETTGLSYADDEIIEIGMRTIAVNRDDYQDIKAVLEYESYNDTDIELDQEIILLTGITKEMIEGKTINWDDVQKVLSASDVLVAHNASFDRHFLEKNIDFKNVWACSKADIDWKSRGFLNSKLELLSIWHGFYYDSHRAMNDVNATVHLLLHPSYEKYPPLEELVGNSKKPQHLIINKFPYNERFIKIIKKRGGYRYNPSDRSWRIILKDKNRLDEESDWLKINIYNGYFQGEIEEISLYNKYKVSTWK